MIEKILIFAIVPVCFLNLSCLEKDRPNVLLITLDTVRADHCSVYGYERPTTPTLERVAREGILFQVAYAPMATTGPSHATLFTSLHPRTHGFLKNALRLHPGFDTLAEVFQRAGYQTAAIVGSFAVDGRFGFDQGFETYDDDFDADGRELESRNWEGVSLDSNFDRDARLVTRNTARWLRNGRDPERPFFLWVHYFDPHAPYEPAEPFRNIYAPRGPNVFSKGSIESAVASYDAEIRETDEAIGQLLRVFDDLELTGSTLLAVVTDHGEGLMQHGHMAHGLHLYEEAVRVLLLFRWPGRLQGPKVLRDPVQLLDLMPTLLDLTRVEQGDSILQGISLAPAMIRSEPLDPQREVFLQRRTYKSRRVGKFFVTGEKFGLRVGPWKYIEAPEESTLELYNLELDPGETINLVAEHPDVEARLAQALQRWRERTPMASVQEDHTISAEDAQKLETLGYVR